MLVGLGGSFHTKRSCTGTSEDIRGAQGMGPEDSEVVIGGSDGTTANLSGGP